MMRYLPSKEVVVVACCLICAACSATGTKERTVHQSEAQKACTEKPPTYSSAVETRLKADLPLQGKTQVQAEGMVNTYLAKYPEGARSGEDLKDYLFYLCQMANNGGWSQDTTERLIRLFIEKWPTQASGISPGSSEQDLPLTWKRLSNADRTKLSLLLSDGKRYKIRIFRTQTLDCIRLASDFYKVFERLQWTQTHEPASPFDWEIPAGIYVATLPDNGPGGNIKNISEQSGARVLLHALQEIGIPVIYAPRGGTVDDLEIHLQIGVRPE